MHFCTARGSARLVHESQNRQKTDGAQASRDRRESCETHFEVLDLTNEKEDDINDEQERMLCGSR